MRSLAILAVSLVLAGCGGGGGTGSATVPSENRVDVVVTGLPAGAAAAITIRDASGQTVGSLAATGETVVSGPGTFNVGNIQSFGVDSSKELYALTSAGGVYRLVRQ